MNTLLTTTALLNMHIHSLPAGGAFRTVSAVTAEHKESRAALDFETCSAHIYFIAF